MPSLTRDIPPNSELHKRLVKAIQTRISYAEKQRGNRDAKWQKAEEEILAYIPESEADAARRNDRDRGQPKYTTIKIPYTYALLMSAHTYWTSVFFARSPIHQYSGRHGESEQQTQALEALISYQVDVGEMLGPYYIWLYDAGKYGIGILGSYWEQEELVYAQIVEEIDETTGEPTGNKLQITTPTAGYEGHKVYNISPYDFYPDPRVPAGQFQKGEFVAIRKRIPWNDVLRRETQGYFMNVKELKRGTKGQSPFSAHGGLLERPDESTFEFDEGSRHPTTVHAFEFYVDLIPREWGLSTGALADTPQKWVFTITSDYSLIIGATPLGLRHGRFPFDVLETEVEAYGMWNRGVPEIMEGVQQTLDWLVNTHFFNVRAALNNQFIIDPSKIVTKDAKNAGPGFIWRLRPEAFGEDVRKFFFQVPVNDVTRTHMTDVNAMLGMGERVLGVNDQIMGMLNSGGRKTATEIRTSTGFGVNRLKTITEYMSATGFAPHSQKLVQTSQQYYQAEKKLRIVGDLARLAGEPFLNVQPGSIEGFYDFVPVDGTLPVDRFAQATLWKDLLTSLRAVPSVLMEYDMGKIFAWVAQLGGIKNIHQFKLEMGSPEQLQQQAAMGNVIPMQGRRPGGAPGATNASTAAGGNALAPPPNLAGPSL